MHRVHIYPSILAPAVAPLDPFHPVAITACLNSTGGHLAVPRR